MTSYDSTFFEIKDSGNFIRVQVIGPSDPNDKITAGPQWINARVYFSLGAFNGDFEIALNTTDFQPFLKKLSILNDSLKGIAMFNTIEGQIEIKVIGDGIGHLDVICILQDRCGHGNSLEAEFQTDQTQLPHLITQLETITNMFQV